MQKRNKTIIYSIIILFYSCTYKETEIVNYEEYYDTIYKKIKVKGQIINSNEEGLWTYYDESGKLIQSGKYSKGIQDGEWTYFFKDILPTSLKWKSKKSLSERYFFSLPTTFISEKDIKESYIAYDSINKDVFSIKESNGKSDEDIKKYAKATYLDLAKNFKIINNSFSKINTSNNSFYIDSYLIKSNGIDSIELFQQNLHSIFQNKIVTISFSSVPKDSLKVKFFIGEIYYHLFVDNKRVAYPFEKLVNKE